MRVREDRQHRLPGGEPNELVEQGRESALSLPLRWEVERRVASLSRDREQRREQRRGPADFVDGLQEQCLQLGQLRCRIVVLGEAGRPLQETYHRPERAAGVVGCTLEGSIRAWGSGARRSHKASTRRDLPMPASPASSTTCPSPSRARAQHESRTASGFLRSTSGVMPAARSAWNRLSARPSPITRQTRDRTCKTFEVAAAEILELE